MPRTLACLVTLLLTSTLSADDWLPLFNGRDLAGWRANNDPDSFQVEDGILRDRVLEVERNLVGDAGQGAEVEGNNDSNHVAQ